jgi:hypothetical protein
MLQAGLCALILLVACTVIHYEALRGMNYALPRLRMPPRIKVVLAFLGAFAAHIVEMALFGLLIFWLAREQGMGTLGGADKPTMLNCMYFSLTTYSSLGYGDVVPTGELKLIAGSEALSGLLLIGWTAAFLYIAMERFWQDGIGTKPR